MFDGTEEGEGVVVVVEEEADEVVVKDWEGDVEAVP
jgi:hypothetical protein